MGSIVADAIKSVKENQYSFSKFISANDSGETGTHQAGLYIPKNSYKLLFDEPGAKGENKEKFAKITWHDGLVSVCRIVYYGQGTRNEYRVTRLGRDFALNDFVVITKRSESEYEGFVLDGESDIKSFLEEFDINEEDTNALIDKNKNTSELSFKPRAHILILLGEELIKSPVMAIYELIKNGYDADAKNVNVDFDHIENVEKATITITDDGIGITEEVLKNVWFEPGTDYRKPINDEGRRVIKRSPIFNRIPMGEKGVGRFAVHKLGNQIRLISRPGKIVSEPNGTYLRTDLHDYELVVDIDWRKFSQSKYLEDVSIRWMKKFDPTSFKFKDTTGTFIQVSSLKEEWTRGMARQLKRQTISMLSPKNDRSKFKIGLDFHNQWLIDFPSTDAVLDLAPYKLTAMIDSDYNLTFEYKFRLANNSEIGERRIDENASDALSKAKYERNVRGELRPFFKSFFAIKQFEDEKIDDLLHRIELSRVPYGTMMLELYSFDLDSISLKDTSGSPSLVKELLKDHAGIKVFKGDLRVYDYGDPGNDWLGLDLKRIQNKEWFSNNQNIGYIYLDPAASGELIEKTNREGFIANESFEHFLVVLDFLLTEFKAERQSDRSVWRRFQKQGPTDSFQAHVSDFKELIHSVDISDDQKERLLLGAKRIEDQYEHDKSSLLLPASVGMTASFAMHEIEKLVPRMKESLNENTLDRKKLSSQVGELHDYVEGILSIVRKGGNKPVVIKDAVTQALNNYTTRLKNRKVEVALDLDPSIETVKCDKRLLITMLMNLIDNSIYWLDTIYRDHKGIYIKTQKTEHGLSILFVDNGPGFKDSVENLVRPFFSRKEGGIGIGLYLIDTIMMQYGKLNILYDKELLLERGLPDRYSGAAVEMMFNKEL